MNRRKMFGSLAAVAGGLLLSASAFGQEKKEGKKKASVKCSGINECKGKGECGAADKSHACKGKNECKGKGWVNVASEKACTDKKGSVVKDKA